MARIKIIIICVVVYLLCGCHGSTVSVDTSGTSSNDLTSVTSTSTTLASDANNMTSNATSTPSSQQITPLPSAKTTSALSSQANGGGVDMNLLYQLLPLLQGDTSQLPAILSRILSAQVTGNDTCSQDVRYIINGLQTMDMFSLQMLDVSGKPQRNLLQGSMIWFGSYDDCRKIHHTVPASTVDSGHRSHRIDGAYVKVLFNLPPTLFPNLGGELGIAAPNGGGLRWDMCVPDSCTVNDITQLINATQITSLGLSVASAEFVEPESIQGDVGAYVCMWYAKTKAIVPQSITIQYSRAVLTVFVMLCVMGTAVDIIQMFYKFDSKAELDVKTPRKENDIGLCSQLLVCFSVRRNSQKLLDCSSPPGSLGCLHGIRVLSMGWVILGHFLLQLLSEVGKPLLRQNCNTGMYFNMLIFVENKKALSDLLKTFWFQCINNGTLSVDSFFLLSGLLVSYLFLREVAKSGKLTLKQMGLFYFHRFWRLTPLYMIVIMMFTNLTKYMSNGPLLEPAQIAMMKENCQKYWWTNLLYINNLYRADASETCMGWSWYIANDMQFYIVSPLALIPLATGRRVIGLLVLAAMFIIHISSSWYIGVDQGFPGAIGPGRNDRYFAEMYVKPYTRIGVYAIGLFLGYVVHVTKGRLKIAKPLLFIGTSGAIVLGIMATYFTYDNFQHGGNVWSSDSYVAHITMFRPAWGLALFWLILVCVHGYAGFINDLLSWEAWIPLSRLTYSAYLIHLIVLQIRIGHMRFLGYFNYFYLINGFISTFTISYAASFVISVMIESPCLALEQVFLKKK